MITLACVLSIFLCTYSFAEDKSITDVEVVVSEKSAKDDPKNPAAWKPEIIISGKIEDYSDLQKIKSISYEKKSDRSSEAYDLKRSSLSEIYDKYSNEEHTALLKLKQADPEAAFQWMEYRIYRLYIPLISPKNDSDAYSEFTAILDDIEVRKDAEVKLVDDTYDKTQKLIDQIYDAEIVKADELYDAREK